MNMSPIDERLRLMRCVRGDEEDGQKLTKLCSSVDTVDVVDVVDSPSLTACLTTCWLQLILKVGERLSRLMLLSNACEKERCKVPRVKSAKKVLLFVERRVQVPLKCLAHPSLFFRNPSLFAAIQQLHTPAVHIPLRWTYVDLHFRKHLLQKASI